jgi:hypothetical protein
MTRLLFLTLFMGSVVCSATNFPSHLGMGSRLSTVGKISSYSSVGKGLWSGYWKPKNVTLSVNEYEFKPIAGEMRAWPNPSNGMFNLDHMGFVRIFSSQGSIVFEGNVEGTINLTNFPTGMYFVNTVNGKTVKIVKQ